jgi:hypothetical protein
MSTRTALEPTNPRVAVAAGFVMLTNFDSICPQSTVEAAFDQVRSLFFSPIRVPTSTSLPLRILSPSFPFHVVL